MGMFQIGRLGSVNCVMMIQLTDLWGGVGGLAVVLYSLAHAELELEQAFYIEEKVKTTSGDKNVCVGIELLC